MLGTENIFCLECSLISLSEDGGLLEIEKLHLIQLLKECICYALIHPDAFLTNRNPLCNIQYYAEEKSELETYACQDQEFSSQEELSAKEETYSLIISTIF